MDSILFSDMDQNFDPSSNKRPVRIRSLIGYPLVRRFISSCLTVPTAFNRRIVELFNSKETSPHNAQLIFNAHDTNSLSYKLHIDKEDKVENMFRRDQIYFAEKIM